MAQIDFEGNNQTNPNQGGTDNSNPNNNPATQQDTTNLNGGENDDITGKDNANNNNNNNNPDNNNPDNSSHEYEEGTEVEFEGNVYVIDKDGNLVNDKGEVFKEAKDVKQWLEDNNASEGDNDGSITIDSIKEAVGIEITGEDGNPIEFTNDAEGINSYINSIITLKSNEIQQGAINKIYSDNPLLKEFIDYVKLTGSPRGFGEIPDRSGIQLDKDNEAQLEAVIKMAANEFGNKSLNDNYIKYLKSTGSLYDEAKVQLEALINKDKEVRKDIQVRADAQRKQEEAELQQYWQNVNNAIRNRRIGEYLLPETIVKDVNGQKITYKLDDFYDYVSKGTEVDANGNRMTGYSRDLDKLSDKDLLERELLDAWLMWTGGSYKDLIDMAIKEDKVKHLVAKSKENNSKRHITIKPNKSGDKSKIIFD